MEKIITLGKHTVTIRPLPYDLWLDLEEERDNLLDSVSGQKEPNLNKINAAFARFGRQREQRELAACVDNWDTLRSSLTIRDVRELARELNKLSQPEIETENLSAAAAGAAVPTA